MMNAMILVSSDKKLIGRKIDDLKEKLLIRNENLFEVKPDKTISIEQIRNIQNSIILKPYGGGNRLIVLYNFDTTTIQAQNSMLKILEEPATNNYFVLITPSIDKIIPTIQSRCQINYGNSTKLNFDIKDFDKYIIFFNGIINSSTGERIKASIKITKTREDTVKFLVELADFLEYILYNNNNSIYKNIDVAKTIDKVVKAIRLIEGNINYKAVTDLLFLSFPKKQIN